MNKRLAILFAVLSLGLGVAMFVVFSGPVGSTALADDEDDNDNGDNGVAGSECGELPSHAELLAAI